MIKILCIGKLKFQELSNLQNDYLKRIGQYHKVEFIQLKAPKIQTEKVNQKKEGELFLKHLKEGDLNIACDEAGKILSSVEFASFLSHQINNLERSYSKMLIIDSLLNIANACRLENYTSFLKNAKEIRRDVVLIRSINSLELHSAQEIIMGFFIRNELYFPIFLYAKIKTYLKSWMPTIIGPSRKKGGPI